MPAYNSWEYDAYYHVEPDNMTDKEIEDFIDEINEEFGKHGWESCGVIGTIILFKRPYDGLKTSTGDVKRKRPERKSREPDNV